jgi:hypothetical protein
VSDGSFTPPGCPGWHGFLIIFLHFVVAQGSGFAVATALLFMRKVSTLRYRYSTQHDELMNDREWTIGSGIGRGASIQLLFYRLH